MAGIAGETKWISVAQLKRLLADWPDTAIVWPNQVGNLTIYERPTDENEIPMRWSAMLGYIDLLTEENAHDQSSSP